MKVPGRQNSDETKQSIFVVRRLLCNYSNNYQYGWVKQFLTGNWTCPQTVFLNAVGNSSQGYTGCVLVKREVATYGNF
jgi:hypothetical protein